MENKTITLSSPAPEEFEWVGSRPGSDRGRTSQHCEPVILNWRRSAGSFPVFEGAGERDYDDAKILTVDVIPRKCRHCRSQWKNLRNSTRKNL
jgi:hypothetical protein